MQDDTNPAVIRFGTNTPFYPLSMTYGLLYDPGLRTWFVSLDHYIGYHMLCRPDDRRAIMNSANGWIANQNLQRILKTATLAPGDPVIQADWEGRRDAIMERGVMLKLSQSRAIADLLTKTGARPVLDESRIEDTHWCNSRGMGNNRHGTLLESARTALQRGSLLDFRS